MGGWWLTAIGALITGFCYSLKKYSVLTKYRLSPRIAYYNDGIADYFRTFIILLLLRSFVVEWSILPSQSLMPTLLVGDRVITDKAAYGIRLPLTGHVLIPLSQLRRGDVIVFRPPIASSNSAINRLVGLPGDRIQYLNRKLVINGKPVPQVEIGLVADDTIESHSEGWVVCEETLEGHVYQIYKNADAEKSLERLKGWNDALDMFVPKGHYFVIGDNRDNSSDSREWGFLPDHCLLGKAKRIYWSSDTSAVWWKPYLWLRWSRIGMKIM